MFNLSRIVDPPRMLFNLAKLVLVEPRPSAKETTKSFLELAHAAIDEVAYDLDCYASCGATTINIHDSHEYRFHGTETRQKWNIHSTSKTDFVVQNKYDEHDKDGVILIMKDIFASHDFVCTVPALGRENGYTIPLPIWFCLKEKLFNDQIKRYVRAAIYLALASENRRQQVIRSQGYEYYKKLDAYYRSLAIEPVDEPEIGKKPPPSLKKWFSLGD